MPEQTIQEKLASQVKAAEAKVVNSNYRAAACDLAEAMRIPYTNPLTKRGVTGDDKPVGFEYLHGMRNEPGLVMPDKTGGVTLSLVGLDMRENLYPAAIWEKLFEDQPVKVTVADHPDQKKYHLITLEFPKGTSLEDHARNLLVLKEVTQTITLVENYDELLKTARAAGSKNAPRDAATEIRISMAALRTNELNAINQGPRV